MGEEIIVKSLDKGYNEVCLDENSKCTKFQYLADYIFNFALYDDEMSELFGKAMCQVIEAILIRKTFEFQKISRENYITFLLMVNMPFLDGKLSYGTSIRGAFFDGEENESIGKNIIEFAKIQ